MEEIKFVVKLAGVPIGVAALYGSTRQFCREYLTKETPVFSVCITAGDIALERQKADSVNCYSDAYLETLALYRKIAAGLLEYDTLREILSPETAGVVINPFGVDVLLRVEK